MGEEKDSTEKNPCEFNGLFLLNYHYWYTSTSYSVTAIPSNLTEVKNQKDRKWKVCLVDSNHSRVKDKLKIIWLTSLFKLNNQSHNRLM